MQCNHSRIDGSVGKFYIKLRNQMIVTEFEGIPRIFGAHPIITALRCNRMGTCQLFCEFELYFWCNIFSFSRTLKTLFSVTTKLFTTYFVKIVKTKIDLLYICSTTNELLVLLIGKFSLLWLMWSSKFIHSEFKEWLARY